MPSPTHDTRTYQEDTYASPNRLVRRAHDSRMETAIEMLTAESPKVVCDYGAGDGELLVRLLRDPRGRAIETMLAFDPVEGFRREMGRRIGDDPRVEIVGTTEEAARTLAGSKIEALACLGVLEHLRQAERERFYDFCDQHLEAEGRAIIDVPIEIGGSLLIKEVGRGLLKERGWEYGPHELLRATVGARTRDPERFDPSNGGEIIFSHKGFDHRVFRDELCSRQRLIEQRCTPVRWLPSWLCNQEVFYVTEPLRRAAA